MTRKGGRTKLHGLGLNDFLGMHKCWYEQTQKRSAEKFTSSILREGNKKEEGHVFKLIVPTRRWYIFFGGWTLVFVCVLWHIQKPVSIKCNK